MSVLSEQTFDAFYMNIQIDNDNLYRYRGGYGNIVWRCKTKMNQFLTHVVNRLSESFEGIQAIVLRGSQQNSQEVDMWSDYDLLVVMNPLVSINENKFIKAVNIIGLVVGSELYSGHDSVLYRTAIEFKSSIELLDATVCSYQEWVHTEPPESQKIVFGQIVLSGATHKSPLRNESFSPNERQINPTWFKYFGAIKRFCRNDNLIGMHLLLDLIREYLVLEMIDRDNRRKTNIHRFGDNERLPDAIKLSHIAESDKEMVLDYIAKLAYEYDQKLSSMIVGYTSRYHLVMEYIERSKAHLLR